MSYANLAHSADNVTWMLTEEGSSRLQPARILQFPRPVFSQQDGEKVPLLQKNKLQLLMHLRAEGWHLEVKYRRDGSKPPVHYKGLLEEPKIYWLRDADRTCHREYLLCLLKQQTEQTWHDGVPHLKSKTFYENMLEGKPLFGAHVSGKTGLTFPYISFDPDFAGHLPPCSKKNGALPLISQPRHASRSRRPRFEPIGVGDVVGPSVQHIKQKRKPKRRGVKAVEPAQGVTKQLASVMPPSSSGTSSDDAPDSESPALQPKGSSAAAVVVTADADGALLVCSAAGGLADKCGHRGCFEEGHTCCTKCHVVLCSGHCGLSGPKESESRCHEHNDFAHCSCQDCCPMPCQTQAAHATEARTSPSSSSSTSSSSTSASSLNSEASHKSTHDDDNDDSDDDASGEVSSGESDEPEEPPQASNANRGDGPPVHAAETEGTERRGVLLESTMFWQGSRFTIVRERGLEVGYEVTCKDPAHNRKGCVPCRRTLRFGKHGGVVQVERLLKWWLLQSVHYATREAHVADCPRVMNSKQPYPPSCVFVPAQRVAVTRLRSR
eukprot:1886900-Amphidinium_carterae.1